jgi:hypothetical protein
LSVASLAVGTHCYAHHPTSQHTGKLISAVNIEYNRSRPSLSMKGTCLQSSRARHHRGRSKSGLSRWMETPTCRCAVAPSLPAYNDIGAQSHLSSIRCRELASTYGVLTMAPHAGFNTSQIKDKARKDLLYLLEGVRLALSLCRETLVSVMILTPSRSAARRILCSRRAWLVR